MMPYIVPKGTGRTGGTVAEHFAWLLAVLNAHRSLASVKISLSCARVISCMAFAWWVI